MIALLKQNLKETPRKALLAKIESWANQRGASVLGFGTGWGDSVSLQIATIDSEHQCAEEIRAFEGVQAVLTKKHPTYWVAPRQGSRTQVQIGPAAFGNNFVSAIAGPCSVENLDDLLALGSDLVAAGATALRGGAFKPRTSPYAFQGLGKSGLEMLAAVREQTGLAVVTEVMDTRDIELVTQYADALQIGSRNMMNYSLLREAGAAGVPVLLKRGMSATLGEFLLAAEYLAHAGCEDIVLCERGLRHFDPEVRNLLDISAVPALQERTHLPVIVDPSHGTGVSSLVAPMMAAAAAAGADGFLVEVHPRPSRSVSDAGQALTPTEFVTAIETTRAVLSACGRKFNATQTPTAN
ncbi:MAG: 3-deoxy-7-phosphoheptulonate synthase [Planctomycetota bacterium]|jgi:3-deoxy-7-phosphoheptulonate synthase|nr:3-deoxy-7-phosphoheptulonate synthase [Planctomycetota bacterium]MDP6941960.1 3-deoxy-7-phosphoheptulonate synthase [Planctomycetota bacterium]